MSDCVREMTPIEKAKFIIKILELNGYNMQQWEKDFLLGILKSEEQFLTYVRTLGYQPIMESLNNIPPSTGSSIHRRED